MFDCKSFLASPNVFLNLSYILLVILFVLRLSSSKIRLPSGQKDNSSGKKPNKSRSATGYSDYPNSGKRPPHPDLIWR